MTQISTASRGFVSHSWAFLFSVHLLQCVGVSELDLRKADTGWYTCKASSETGETTWSAALVVETPTDPSIIFHRTPEPTTFPGPPAKPSVAEVTETAARLSWRANPSHGASPVHSYTVEYFSHETGDVRCPLSRSNHK